jgi:hypothetical protein
VKKRAAPSPGQRHKTNPGHVPASLLSRGRQVLVDAVPLVAPPRIAEPSGGGGRAPTSRLHTSQPVRLPGSRSSPSSPMTPWPGPSCFTSASTRGARRSREPRHRRTSANPGLDHFTVLRQKLHSGER